MEEQLKKMALSDGLQVGIKNLDNTLREVAQLKLSGLQLLSQELLNRVKACGNYVPSSAEDEYAASLLREYLKKYGETEEIRDRNSIKIESHKHTSG
jgi:hypothetical protein